MTIGRDGQGGDGWTGLQVTGSEALHEEGRAWVHQLLSGAATHGDALALARWRALSPDHEAAFVEAARMRGFVRDAVADLEFERKPILQAPQRSSRAFSRRVIVGGALAASAAGVGLLLTERAGVGPLAPAVDFATGKGETRKLELSHGGEIELNTLTRIALRPKDGVDAFELLEGEIIASLIHGRSTQLTIFAGAGRVLADQGRIGLRKLQSGVSVSCLEGGAQIVLGRARASLATGHALSYAGTRLGDVVAIDPSVVEGWRRGVLIFRDRPLGDVIAEINRYRPGRIVLANPALASRRVSGTFYLNAIDQILEQMRLAYGARVSRLPGGVVLVS